MHHPLSWTIRPIAILLLLGIPAGAPLGAQRAELFTRRLVRRSPGDTTVRRMHQRLDSLLRLFNEDDELSLDERRRVGDELDRTVDELSRISMGMLRSDDEFMRLRVAPMSRARTSNDMLRALTRRSPRATTPPRGWIGIDVTGAAREPWVENNEVIVRYLTYPEIVSVEPSSPAERAGLLPGDTLMGYNGQDVRETNISITRLLKPNARVLVRIRRDGRTREVPVTIADVPSRIQLRPEFTTEMSIAGIPDPIASPPSFPPFPLAPLPPRSPRSASGLVGVHRPVAAPAPRPDWPIPSAAMMFYRAGINGVAGAQLSAVTEGLARTIGVRFGVLVLAAPPGSPAAQSGLRDGDVIVKANGEELRTVPRLRELLGAAVDRGNRSMLLQIVRDRKPRTMRLSWRAEDANELP